MLLETCGFPWNEGITDCGLFITPQETRRGGGDMPCRQGAVACGRMGSPCPLIARGEVRVRPGRRCWVPRPPQTLCPQWCCELFLFLEAVLEQRQCLVRYSECLSDGSYPLEQGQPSSLLWGMHPRVLRCLLRSWGPSAKFSTRKKRLAGIAGAPSWWRKGGLQDYSLQLRKACQEFVPSLPEVRVRGAFSCQSLR